MTRFILFGSLAFAAACGGLTSGSQLASDDAGSTPPPTTHCAKPVEVCAKTHSLCVLTCPTEEDGGTSEPAPDSGATEPDSGVTELDGGMAPPDSGTVFDGSPGTSCTTDGQCGAGESCAWPTAGDACDALDPDGICVTDLAGACGAEQLVTGCDCGGHDVTWLTGCSGLPQGYAPTMLAHVGSCLDASPGESDGGGPVPDASLPIGCSESKDCPTGEECGYEIELACSATAQCLPYAAFGLCNSIMPACSCTGQTIGISGCASAVGQPIQHIGACAGQEGGL